jgi:arabinan endo-1,5-alpha-L-arabinosidase
VSILILRGEEIRMSKRLSKKLLLLLLMLALILPASVFAKGKGVDTPANNKVNEAANQNSNKPYVEHKFLAPKFQEASVHDPSVIKVGDTFYVFGSHLAAAKSKDLIKWERFAEGANVDNPLFDDVINELKATFDWAESDTLWAADVIQLEDGKFYMYYNACKGDSPRSALGVAVADHVEGPYKDLGIILKSGMWGQPSEDGTIYDATIHPNAVDPALFFDKEGKLWMVYGSYSGGIFILEMDPTTAKPFPDQGYGAKLLGGNHSRIEGAYILHSPETDFYYMFITYGGLDAVGGYNMRVMRSENPDGPYYDAEGNDMINVRGRLGTIFDDRSIEPFGVKQMGNFLFKRMIGDPGEGIGTGYVSPGHNSAYYDADTGKHYLFFHTRFPQRGEAHEVRVHQMFMNQDGWPVVAPYRYGGETATKINRLDVVGDYQFINHGKEISAQIKNSVFVQLKKDGTISGDVSGTWEKQAHNRALLMIEEKVYSGIFLRQWDTTSQSYVMTFSALSEQGVAIWGSKMADKTDEEIVESVREQLNLGDTSRIINNINLPLEATRHTGISWQSSNSEIVSETGVIKRPEVGQGNVTVTLTATITKGDASTTKQFTVIVQEKTIGGLVAHYSFDGNLHDRTSQFGVGKVVGNQINSPGGNITYTDGLFGQAAYFDGSSGIHLPNGLISSNAYTVSLWLNPEELTNFTTTFFGARDMDNWVSFLAGGHPWSDDRAMVWSGTTWYDATTSKNLTKNEWTHVAFTVENGRIKIFINGEESFNNTGFPNVFTTTNATFSLAVNWWDTPFKGMMDELKIYERALTTEEITNLAQK